MGLIDFVADPFRFLRPGSRAYEGGASNHHQLRDMWWEAEHARAHQHKFDYNVHFLKQHMERPVKLSALEHAFNVFETEFHKELERMQAIGNRSFRVFYTYGARLAEVNSWHERLRQAFSGYGREGEWRETSDKLRALNDDFGKMRSKIRNEANNLSTGNFLSSVKSFSMEGSRTLEREMKARVSFARGLDRSIEHSMGRLHDKIRYGDFKSSAILMNELVGMFARMFDTLYALNHFVFVLIYRYGGSLDEVISQLEGSRLKKSYETEAQKEYNFMRSRLSEMHGWFEKYKESYFRLANNFARS